MCLYVFDVLWSRLLQVQGSEWTERKGKPLVRALIMWPRGMSIHSSYFDLKTAVLQGWKCVGRVLVPIAEDQKELQLQKLVIRLNCQSCTRTIQNHPEPSRTIQNHPEPSRTIQNHPEPSRTIQNHPEPSRTIQNHPEPSVSSKPVLGTGAQIPLALGPESDFGNSPSNSLGSQDYDIPKFTY